MEAIHSPPDYLDVADYDYEYHMDQYEYGDQFYPAHTKSVSTPIT